MTEILDLDAIEREYNDYPHSSAWAYSRHIPALLAEVRRLRTKVNNLNEYLELYNPDIYTEDEPC